jgi:enoyl-CoA hydratase
MADQTFESLRIERKGHVAEVTLLGPGKGNAMGPAFWREMPIAFEQLDQDPEVRAILISGSGSHFSYGLDIPGMMNDLGPLISGESLAGPRTELLNLIRRMQKATDAVVACRKPVVAAISGWCIGAGVDLITACDVRVCSKEAKFSVREVRVGITADMGSLQRLPTIIGDGQTRRLALTGEDFDAARALRLGLVSDVYETPEELLREARKVTETIANNAPLVVQGVKQVMNFGQGKSVGEGLQYVAVWNAAFLQSEDFAEAISAFLERRPPVFKGR